MAEEQQKKTYLLPKPEEKIADAPRQGQKAPEKPQPSEKAQQRPAEKKKESKAEGEKKELLAESEISLLLDTYDDIFSDFDPRPYSERSLSVDFLDETKRATVEAKPGSMQLRFMIPDSQRDQEQEAVIKKRLRAHFRKHLDILESQRRVVFREGVALTAIGAIMLLAATFVASEWERGIVASFLLVILEPAGWFTIWSGFETSFYKTAETKKETEFYRKMAKADTVFMGF